MILCGIDEAGRGCIAGDLVVAGVVFENSIVPKGVGDSKKITPKRRELLYEEIINATQYHIVTISPQEVDSEGISKCMQRALSEILERLKAQKYLFDGNTAFGIENLETLIKADAEIPEVSAASILAKVTHDRNIIRDAKRYPEYAFEKHKGYGTKLHVEMIKKHGYCPIHRKSFRLKALEATLS